MKTVKRCLRFFLLFCFFYIALKKAWTFSLKLTLLFSFLLTVAYAILDELHQGLAAGRTPYIGDVFLDSFGALLAVVLLMVIPIFEKEMTKISYKSFISSKVYYILSNSA